MVKGDGKYEELVVCSQEIAASTAQLVVASKVKAQPDSENLMHLSDASKGVTTATGLVVASAKSGAQHIEEIGELSIADVVDFNCLVLIKCNSWFVQKKFWIVQGLCHADIHSWGLA